MNYILYLITKLDTIHLILDVLLAIQTFIIIFIFVSILTSLFGGVPFIRVIKDELLKFGIFKKVPYFVSFWLYLLLFITCIGLQILLPNTENGLQLYFENQTKLDKSDPAYQQTYEQFKKSILIK